MKIQDNQSNALNEAGSQIDQQSAFKIRNNHQTPEM